MNEKAVTKIQKYHINFKKIFPHVGIYARVSTRSAAQLHSMAAQVSQLTRFVASRMDWHLVDIYMDFDSASGSTKRPEFDRMVEDAKAGRIDAVITKSVQRFGRNTEETLTTMRELLAAGVIIYFSIEGYASDSPDAELQTALRTGLAAADNASHREERKWGVQRKIEDGTSELYRRPCYGYKKTKDGVLVIDQPKARIVKEIFDLYLSGESISGIKKNLEQRRIPSPTGKETWPMRTIDMMLSNEKYTGDIVLFKTITVNYPYSVRRSNKGAALHEQFCMTNGVDAVISKETFEAVQSEKKRRSNIVIDESGNKQRTGKKYSAKKKKNSVNNLSIEK